MNKPTQIIVAILVIALLGAGVWWGGKKNVNCNTTVANTNSQDNINTNATVVDRTGWKTYRNIKYGYEFQYPQWWQLADSMNSGVINQNDSSIAFADVNPFYVNSFRVAITDPVVCSTITECVSNIQQNDDGQLYEKDAGFQRISLGGNEGLGNSRIRLDSGKWHYKTVYILKNYQLYKLYSISDPDQRGINDAIVEAIFSSVKFNK